MPVTLASGPTSVRAPAELARIELVTTSTATTPTYHIRLFMPFAPFSHRRAMRGGNGFTLLPWERGNAPTRYGFEAAPPRPECQPRSRATPSKNAQRPSRGFVRRTLTCRPATSPDLSRAARFPTLVPRRGSRTPPGGRTAPV